MLSWHIRIFFILFLSSIFLRKTNHGKVWSTPYRSPYCPRDFHGQLFLAHGVIIDVVVFVPKALGITTTVLPGNQGNYGAVISRGGGWLLDPGEKTSRCKPTDLCYSAWFLLALHALHPPARFSHRTCCCVVFISWDWSINEAKTAECKLTSQNFQ